jgi:hypothetical protein
MPGDGQAVLTKFSRKLVKSLTVNWRACASCYIVASDMKMHVKKSISRKAAKTQRKGARLS